MNGAVLMAVAVAWFVLAYFVLGRRLNRLFGVDPTRPTPAHRLRDGVDYEPTPAPVLFGHHFASIAGAGPIVGPVLALTYGWLPAVVWILFGCVLVGAFHDFAAMFLSVRCNGRSIGFIIEEQIGYAGRQIFLLFCWAALVLVVTIFASLVARTFVDTPAVATASILFIALAPLFGWLTQRRGLALLPATLIFVPLLFASICVGMVLPIDLKALLGVVDLTAVRIWMVVLLAYAALASIIPVWLMLQPRDYLNAYLLYVMIALGLVGVFVAAPAIRMPALPPDLSVLAGFGRAFPLLFVTIACGACSGFHALVASGTSAKQIADERHILPVAYGGMLVEGVLAILAVVSVAGLSQADFAARDVAAKPIQAFASGVAGFAETIGVPGQVGLTFVSLSISAFMLTSLDTATRLARFVWEELFLARGGRLEEPGTAGPSRLAHPWVATGIVVVAALAMGFTSAAKQIWPVFGASNQLLAALTLLVVALWLFRQGRPCFHALGAMVFMLVVSIWALLRLLLDNLHRSTVLVCASGFLLLMAAALCVLAIDAFRRGRRSVGVGVKDV